MSRASEANAPRKHVVKAASEDVSLRLVDAWPGDHVDIHLSCGLKLFLKVGPDGSYEYR